MDREYSLIDYSREDCFRMVVTPEIARYWLDKNKENRNLKQRQVFLIAKDITEGKWDSSIVNPIKFLKDGTLQDGQHRLSAIVSAGIPIKVWIATGGNPTIHCDDNIPRNISDRIICGKLADKDSAYTDGCVISVCNFLTSYNHKVDIEALCKWMKKYPKGCEFIHSVAGKRHTGFSARAAYILSAVFLAYENNVPDSVLFNWYKVLNLGYTNTNENIIPIIKLRNEIINFQKNKIIVSLSGAAANTLHYKVQQSIYAYWKNKNPKVLQAEPCFYLPETEVANA